MSTTSALVADVGTRMARLGYVIRPIWDALSASCADQQSLGAAFAVTISPDTLLKPSSRSWSPRRTPPANLSRRAVAFDAIRVPKKLLPRRSGAAQIRRILWKPFFLMERRFAWA
eukprot:scaffold922_cov327-Pinguiococcus_pyrenoidosus.AAC.12